MAISTAILAPNTEKMAATRAGTQEQFSKHGQSPKRKANISLKDPYGSRLARQVVSRSAVRLLALEQ